MTDKIDIPGIREIPGDIAIRDPRIAGRNTVTRTLRNLEFMIQECNGSGMMRDRFEKSCRECNDSGSQEQQSSPRNDSIGILRNSQIISIHVLYNSSAMLQQKDSPEQMSEN